MHVRWPRRQHGPSRGPGAVTLIAVALVVFASAFGVARAAGSGDPSGQSGADKPQPIALRTASALPAMNAPPGPTEAELAAKREAKREARERARKRRLAKERKAAEEAAARDERTRLRAERRAQRAAEREAEAERQAAEKRKAAERRRQQEENAPQQPEQTTPEPPPTSTAPVGQPFDDSG
jgi:hypothetical protein